MAVGFFNGKFVSIDDPVVPLEDRGYQFGDGVYEVIRVYQGMPFLLEEHLERLQKSASAISIELPYSPEEIKHLAEKGVKRSKLDEVEIYLQVTRGIHPRQHAFPDVPPSLSMTFRKVRVIPEKHYQNGVNVLLMDDERWSNCHIKSLNLLPNVLAKQTAYSKGCYEAVFVKDGFVTEGSSSNVFAVKNGTIYTPPLSKKILSGITRKVVVNIAQEIGLPLIEEEITPQFLKGADEVFLTGTVIEVLPVRQIDEQMIGSGEPGKVTLQLHEKYRRIIDNQIKKANVTNGR